MVAQDIKNLKLIGYKRLVTGGASRNDENGTPVNTTHYQYDIFLETISKHSPVVQQIWVNNQLYTTQIILEKALPITLFSEKKQYILVKKSNKFVWRLLLLPKNPTIQSDNNLPIEKAIYEIVVLLKGSSKKLLLKKLIELPPIITE